MVSDYISTPFGYCLKHLCSGICLLCQDKTYTPIDLCAACEKELPYLNYICTQCALPLPGRGSQTLCRACLAKETLPSYRIFSPFFYKFPIDRLIIKLKFKGQLNISKVLGHLMVRKMEKIYHERELPNIIIPIPLHKTRLIERGFNQALELAKPISQALNIPIDSHSCSRVRSTKPQMGLPKRLRLDNVTDALAIKKNFYAKRVCLIDDVLTTGHTAITLSKALLKTGVQFIDIWCCARASLKKHFA